MSGLEHTMQLSLWICLRLGSWVHIVPGAYHRRNIYTQTDLIKACRFGDAWSLIEARL